MRKALSLLPNGVCWLVLFWALCLSFVYVWACLLHQFAVLGSQAAQRYVKQPWRVPHHKHEKQPTLAQWAPLHTGIYWASVLAHFVFKKTAFTLNETSLRFIHLLYFFVVWEMVRSREYFGVGFFCCFFCHVICKIHTSRADAFLYVM